MLHPNFPVVEGTYQFTKSWSVALPEKFNRRIEEGDLVLWKPGFTMFLTVWNNDQQLNFDDFFRSIVMDISPDAFDVKTEISSNIKLFSYRLIEETEDNRAPAFYCFAVSERDYVQTAMYFDSESDVLNAIKIWKSFNFGEAP